jgi:alkylation response protein AidB-like acyl-CoA dehydrogenase
VDFSLSAEQEHAVSTARRFAHDRVAPRAAAIDATGDYPRDLVAEAAGLGLLGVTIPAVWGGAGRDYVAYALATEAVASTSATLAVILTVANSLVAEPIHEFGTDRQKDRWLRPLVSGRSLGAFALSEEQAGSDAANQHTTARAIGDGYVLSGRKVWVANAEVADMAIVFARTSPDTHGIGAFLVPLDQPGIRRTTSDSLGVRGLGCVDLDLSEVRLPADSRLGSLTQGFHIAMRALDGGRIGIAAQALGVGQTALDEALAYARERHAFGQQIGDFQAIQFQLADLATSLEAARMLTWKAADQHGRVARPTLAAAMAKLQASEAAHAAADRAMQILASAGYRRGSTIERLFRDIRAAEIYQGTSEVQRMIIARELLDRDAH